MHSVQPTDVECERGSATFRGAKEIVRELRIPFFGGLGAVTLAAAVGGWFVRYIIDDTAIVRFDVRLAETLERERTATLDDVTGIANFFADPIPVAVLWALGMVIAGFVFRHWRGPLLFMVTVGGEKLSYLFATLLVMRPRPEVSTVGKVHVTSSYPSGHTGSAVSVWLALAIVGIVAIRGRLSRRSVIALVVFGVLVGSTVGIARMYRGHHFLTDVIAGGLIGAVWVLIGWMFVLRPHLERNRTAIPDQPIQRSVAPGEAQ